jgi:ferredoxin-like protein FixX
VSRELHGYTLMLACEKCGLKRKIRRFPTQGAPLLGRVLDERNISIWEKGCLRCGTCRFVVLTAPPQESQVKEPVGWAKRT